MGFLEAPQWSMSSSPHLSDTSGAGPRWSAWSRGPPQRWVRPGPPPWNLPQRQWPQTASSACHLEAEGGQCWHITDTLAWGRQKPRAGGTRRFFTSDSWTLPPQIHLHCPKPQWHSGFINAERPPLRPSTQSSEDCRFNFTEVLGAFPC